MKNRRDGLTAMRLGDRTTKETFRIIVLLVLGRAAIRLIWSVL